MRAICIAAALVLAVVAVGGTPAAAETSQTTDVRLITFNDLHGNLTPPAGSSGAGHVARRDDG